jgi:hypothetical protein
LTAQKVAQKGRPSRSFRAASLVAFGKALQTRPAASNMQGFLTLMLLARPESSQWGLKEMPFNLFFLIVSLLFDIPDMLTR